MKRYSTLLFLVAIFTPFLAFAEECADPAKVVIGFLMIVTLFNVGLFTLILGAYFLTGGRKLLKLWSIFIIIFLLVGVASVTAGLVKEYSKNDIPFLHPACEE